MSDNIIFLYQAKAGAALKSYGIQVAKLAGIPEDVLAQAKSILHGLEVKDHSLTSDAPPVTSLNQGALPSFVSGVDFDALITALKALDPNRLTPMEALSQLADLKSLIKPG